MTHGLPPWGGRQGGGEEQVCSRRRALGRGEAAAAATANDLAGGHPHSPRAPPLVQPVASAGRVPSRGVKGDLAGRARRTAAAVAPRDLPALLTHRGGTRPPAWQHRGRGGCGSRWLAPARHPPRSTCQQSGCRASAVGIRVPRLAGRSLTGSSHFAVPINGPPENDLIDTTIGQTKIWKLN